MNIKIKHNLFKFLLAAFVLGLCLLLWQSIMPYFSKQQKAQTNVASIINNGPNLKSFSLIDTHGRNFTEKSLRGHWTLMFFGYAKCLDICPRTLSIIKESWQIFNTANKPVPVRFVFADINTTQVDNAYLREFLYNYNADFLGISGAPDDMREFSDQLGIYTKNNGDKIDHTATLLLLNPYGKLSAVFSPPFSAQDIVHDLEILTL